MDSAIIANAKTVQLIGLAILAIMVIIIGARIAGMGAKGFASLLGEIVGLLVALYFIARPNDVANALLKSVGGVQTPAMPTGAGIPERPEVAFIVQDAA